MPDAIVFGDGFKNVLQLGLVDTLLPQHTPAPRKALLEFLLLLLLSLKLLLLPAVLQPANDVLNLLCAGLLCDVSRRVVDRKVLHFLGRLHPSELSYERLCLLRLLDVVVLRCRYFGAHNLCGLLFSLCKLLRLPRVIGMPRVACNEFFFVNLLFEVRTVIALDGDFEFAGTCRIGLVFGVVAVFVIRALVVGFRVCVVLWLFAFGCISVWLYFSCSSVRRVSKECGHVIRSNRGRIGAVH